MVNLQLKNGTGRWRVYRASITHCLTWGIPQAARKQQYHAAITNSFETNLDSELVKGALLEVWRVENS